MENGRKRLDFVSSIVIFAVAVYVLVESVRIYTASGKPFYLSPALVPTMLGSVLLVLAIVQFFQSIGGGIAARLAECKTYFAAVRKDPNTVRMLIGLGLMAVYTFLLIELLPFWLATFLFAFLLMFFLDAGSIIKILLISVATSALIVFLFQVCFRVPLP